MNLPTWLANGWLRPYQTSAAEIRELWLIAGRDLKDAESGGISPDWQYGIAYNAALKLCTILLYAEGYRPEKQLAHYRTLQALPVILGAQRQDDGDFLERCRQKRNTVEYDRAGAATREEAQELIQFSHELRDEVLAWLKTKHPGLVPP
jgi:uncharacterized protein (UPF0332 family)